jgi:hypothetical protein
MITSEQRKLINNISQNTGYDLFGFIVMTQWFNINNTGETGEVTYERDLNAITLACTVKNKRL